MSTGEKKIKREEKRELKWEEKKVEDMVPKQFCKYLKVFGKKKLE